MPTVPTLDDRRPGITPLQPARARGEDFAREGRSLQRLGQATERLGGTLVDIEAKEQERENLDAVFRAETELKNQEAEHHNQVRQRRGLNAEKVTKETVEFWEKAPRDLQSGLSNDPQRRAFEKIALDRRRASLDFVSRYQATEMHRARLEAAEASSAATIRAGIENPAAAELNSAALERTWRAIGQTEGLDTKVVDQKILDARTAMHTGVIAAMVDTAPSAARTYYKAAKEKGEINPRKYADIEKALRAGTLKGFSQNKAAELLAKHGETADGYDAAIKEARESLKDADRQAATVAQLKARFSERRALDIGARREMRDHVLTGLITSGTVDGVKVRTVTDLPARYLEGLGADNLATVESYLSAKAKATPDGFAEKTDFGKLDEAQKKIRVGDINDPAELGEYKPHLEEPDYRDLRGQLEDAKKVKPSVLLDEFEDRIGESRTKWRDDEDIQAQWRDYRSYVTRRIDEGARAKDITEVTDQFFIEAVRRGSGYFGSNVRAERDLLGVAQVRGDADEFFIEDMGPEGRRAMDIARRVGVKLPTGDFAREQFYTDTWLPAVRYLEKSDLAVTPEAVAAVAVLRANGRPVTPQEIANLLDTQEFAGGR